MIGQTNIPFSPPSLPPHPCEPTPLENKEVVKAHCVMFADCALILILIKIATTDE